MPHHQVTDFEQPDRFDPATRAAVIAYITERILDIAPDRDGNVHRRDVLDAITDEANG